MGVHATGAGSGWDEASPDVDQPHGLDYREEQDIRKGVRKRVCKEHVTFADATVGGEHKPGGCAVLGMDITTDCTDGVAADGTYVGHGLVWSLSDTSNYGVLFCATGDGTAPTGDWTVLRMHPDLQWGGADVTWAGAHEFDASVDISGNVALDGDLTVDGAFALGGNAKIVGDCSVDSTFTVGADAAFHDDVSIDGDLVVDGTVIFDQTNIQFGEGVGIGLFYDPTTYIGGESITLGNGLIIKSGSLAYQASQTLDVSFGVAFNAVLSAFLSMKHSAAGAFPPVIYTYVTTGLQIKTSSGAGTTLYWLAIGR